MTCPTFTIAWNTLSLPAWQERFLMVRRSSILQSYPYARFAAAHKFQRPRFGLIKINGQEAGLVQILEAGLFKNALHAVILDRGPLWFEGFETAENLKAFLETFNREFPCRFGRRRRIFPETQTDLSGFGFTPHKKSQPYKTLWLDLTTNEDTLRASLKKNWRSALANAEHENLSIEWDNQGVFLPWLLQNHQDHRTEKNYGGADTKTLARLAHFFKADNGLVLGRILKSEQPVAGVLFLIHGSSATYQIGWSDQTGRESCAMHLLLWQGLLRLKGGNIRDLDLGGVNDREAPGIGLFKRGLGGAEVTIPGQYR